MPKSRTYHLVAVFLFIFGSLAHGGDLILHTHVEDAAVDVKGLLYLLKVENKNLARRVLVSRYLRDGSLDRTFANQGHLLVEFKLPSHSDISNGKLAICPKTGDLFVAFGTFRKPEGGTIAATSTETDVAELFQRAGYLGDNRSLIVRFSPEGKRRENFGKSGIAAFSVSNDNSDRLYTFSITEAGKLFVSWRHRDSTTLFVRKADGTRGSTHKFNSPGGEGELFMSNAGSTERGGLLAAGVRLTDGEEGEVAQPVVFKGKRMTVLDRLFPEVEGNRGLQSAILLPGNPSQMVVVVPEESRDRLERLELLTGDGYTEGVTYTDGKLVNEVMRATPRNAVVMVTTKPEVSQLVVTESDPMNGRVVRQRTVGEILTDAGGLMPRCVDIIKQ